MEALEFLKQKNAELAPNSFSRKEAISFVKKLYKLGALKVTVDPDVGEDGYPYAAATDIVLPKSLSKRLDIAVIVLSQHPDEVSALSDVMRKPDWHKGKMVSVWWD